MDELAAVKHGSNKTWPQFICPITCVHVCVYSTPPGIGQMLLVGRRKDNLHNTINTPDFWN